MVVWGSAWLVDGRTKRTWSSPPAPRSAGRPPDLPPAGGCRVSPPPVRSPTAPAGQRGPDVAGAGNGDRLAVLDDQHPGRSTGCAPAGPPAVVSDVAAVSSPGDPCRRHARPDG